MLTIDEIKNVSFRKAGMGGYKPEDVDEFIDQVVATIQQKDAEKKELVRKLDILATKIEQYRADEETVRNALISSQRVADTTQKEAEEKANYIIKSAESKAKAILSEAEMATEHAKDKFQAVHTEAAQLKEELLAVYKKHLSVIGNLPEYKDIEDRRAELDKKYPFTPMKTEEKKEAAPAPVEEKVDVEEKMAKATEKEEPVVKENIETERKAVEFQPNDEKFDTLKFGDNYDVE